MILVLKYKCDLMCINKWLIMVLWVIELFVYIMNVLMFLLG